MKLLIDENVPHSLVIFLKNKNYQILDIKNSPLKQNSDYQLATQENLTIITFDKDFLGIKKSKTALKCIFLNVKTLNIQLLQSYLEIVLEKCQNIPENQGFLIFCAEHEISIM